MFIADDINKSDRHFELLHIIHGNRFENTFTIVLVKSHLHENFLEPNSKLLRLKI